MPAAVDQALCLFTDGWTEDRQPEVFCEWATRASLDLRLSLHSLRRPQTGVFSYTGRMDSRMHGFEGDAENHCTVCLYDPDRKVSTGFERTRGSPQLPLSACNLLLRPAWCSHLAVGFTGPTDRYCKSATAALASPLPVACARADCSLDGGVTATTSISLAVLMTFDDVDGGDGSALTAPSA